MMFFGSWMWILWIVIIGLIVWGAVALIRHRTSASMSGSNRSPMEIAKERYAKGEITKEDFDRIRTDLS